MQGCPLSLFIFIMVLTIIFEDVDYALLALGQPVRPVYDLEYADDTLLFSLTTTQLQLASGQQGSLQRCLRRRASPPAGREAGPCPRENRAWCAGQPDWEP